MNNKQKGNLGEGLARRYLSHQQYQILEHNYRCKMGEVDIIVWDKRKEELVFVEVKTRSKLTYGRPIEAVDEKKRRHILLVAKKYLYQKQIKEVSIRFDVIEVFLSATEWRIRHWKSTF